MPEPHEQRRPPTWTAGPESAGARADVFLAEKMAASRSEAQRLIQGGNALLNDCRCSPGTKLKEGDRFTLVRPEPAPSELIPEAAALSILYEDSHLMVIDKPRGMVVHPSAGHRTGTLVHAVLGHAEDLSGIGGEERPGIVHRLDKDTSGVLVVAKTDAAHRSLQAQIQAKTATREYVALVWGSPKFEEAIVEAPIGRHPVDRKRMAVVTDGRKRAREATTRLRILERLGPFCLASASLETGRTHQIRVHCLYIGHPVVGDPAYGGLRKIPLEAMRTSERTKVEEAIRDLGGQALHARKLAFRHPATGEELIFEAPLPVVFESLLSLIRSAIP